MTGPGCWNCGGSDENECGVCLGCHEYADPVMATLEAAYWEEQTEARGELGGID